jgi:ppGpp synthetase/RelA/SpoT-type nucleotidyltranferase
MSGPENHAEPVREAVRAYAARQPQLVAATAGWVTLVRTLLDDAGIDYLSVTGRTKSVASFSAKANRTDGDRLLYPDPLEQITDQIGVRVITYVHSDVAAVAELLEDDDDSDSDDGDGHPELAGERASIQVRTVLQHAWAEFEHDIRYKGNVPEDAAADLDRRFTLAAGLIELADREFATIRERIQQAAPGSTTEVEADHIVGQELATFLAGHYSDAGWSHTDHYDWIAGLLTQLGIDSVDDLDDLLTSVDADAVIRRMGYRYPAGAVRRLDDALLAIFGEQYVTLEGNSHRVPLLRARLEKLSTPET